MSICEDNKPGFPHRKIPQMSQILEFGFKTTWQLLISEVTEEKKMQKYASQNWQKPYSRLGYEKAEKITSVFEPNSSSVPSNTKGLEGDFFFVFWFLPQTLVLATEVNVATTNSQKKKINTMSSDKVHECSIKNNKKTKKQQSHKEEQPETLVYIHRWSVRSHTHRRRCNIQVARKVVSK